MKKKFKTRKHTTIKITKKIIIILIIIIICIILHLIIKIKIFSISAVSLIQNTNPYNTINIDNTLMKIISSLVRVDINRPNTILQNVMIYESPNSIYYAIENEKAETNEETNIEPTVYIYNTHDTEEYIDYNVFEASFYLQEKLKELGINSIVEENRTSTIRDNNGWNYAQSYKASRINLEKVKNENPTIKLYIDLHRDSVGKNYTSTTIDNKNYAKVLFVIGKDHNNYLENLYFTQSIDDTIKNYANISKGILEKSGYGVNGIYNQDIDSSVILMEVGGNENTKEEVTNTLDIMSKVIKEIING